jgi:hypothetical protein
VFNDTAWITNSVKEDIPLAADTWCLKKFLVIEPKGSPVSPQKATIRSYPKPVHASIYMFSAWTVGRVTVFKSE